jgi:RNA polymerase sigma-70 factor (ECF subfamily)
MPHLRSRPALLEAFRRGDRDALETVYWAYVDRVASVARRFVAPNEAADLVQDVFLRAFEEKNRRAYDGLRDYGPYLGTIARNLLVDRARRMGRELLAEDGTFEELADLPANENDAPPWADTETMNVVERYIAALSPELRDLHEARYVKGLPQRAAAVSLGISRQQLRTREAQLRDGLRDALEKSGRK